MRRAMAEAEVGDDVYAEDPTINRLQRRAAEIFGKEAALFVPSGTMGNDIGVKLHTSHGQEVICEARSHVFNYELGMMAWFSGCVARPVSASDGILTWKLIEPAIRPASVHNAPTGLVSLENSHNMAGGVVSPKEVIDDICDHAHGRDLKVHLDGARIFNAATYLGITVKDLCEKVDTIMFCLSKGLCAPAGSMLLGTAENIRQAWLYRKRLGGGMRQVGVLGAPGLIALEDMSRRLAHDQANARFLADCLARIPGICIDPAKVETNIVIFDVSPAGMDTSQVSAGLKARGILANGISPTHMRMVTHHDVDRTSCERAMEAMGELMAVAA
jgi:threonine aldolase